MTDPFGKRRGDVMSMPRYLSGLLAGVLLIVPARAQQRVKFYDDGELALHAVTLEDFVEPSVPVYHNGVRVDDPGTSGADVFDVVELYDKVPGASSWPLTWADLVANTYVRPTYYEASLGTSVVATVSYRTSAGLQFLPTVERADVTTGIPERVRSVVTAQFPGAAAVTSTRVYPDPILRRTETLVNVRFEATSSIALDAGLIGSDAFRLMTVSSMFANEAQYDANVLWYEDAAGLVHELRLTNATPRGAHLMPAAVEMGDWFALRKEPGSTWHPSSPTLRVDLLGVSGVAGRLGVQGWLAPSTDPNEDSLNVWIEWMDAPATIPAGTVIEVDLLLTATEPQFPGDANLDSVIDEADAAALLSAWGARPGEVDYEPRTDFDDDGRTNLLDAFLLNEHWGTHHTGGADGGPPAAAPEPATAGLLCIGLAAIRRRRRRQIRHAQATL
jgi:hypothetical protein